MISYIGLFSRSIHCYGRHLTHLSISPCLRNPWRCCSKELFCPLLIIWIFIFQFRMIYVQLFMREKRGEDFEVLWTHWAAPQSNLRTFIPCRPLQLLLRPLQPSSSPKPPNIGRRSCWGWWSKQLSTRQSTPRPQHRKFWLSYRFLVSRNTVRHLRTKRRMMMH